MFDHCSQSTIRSCNVEILKSENFEVQEFEDMFAGGDKRYLRLVDKEQYELLLKVELDEPRRLIWHTQRASKPGTKERTESILTEVVEYDVGRHLTLHHDWH